MDIKKDDLLINPPQTIPPNLPLGLEHTLI